MPAPKRRRVELTDDWQTLQLLLQWPEQILYELIRPVVLFGQSPAERAKQTGKSSRTIHPKADRFDAHGMVSLFADFRSPKDTDRRSLPPPLRQFIDDRKTEHPAFTPHELATLCYVASGRRPSSHTVKRVLATGPKPTSISRRYPRYHQMEDPAERRLTIVRLHAEGWTVSAIAAYLETSRPTVYATLRRWIEEGVPRLEDKAPIPKYPKRKVDMRVMNEVRKLQESPELREFRVHAWLKQLDIDLSPRTCGRILALNRSLYKLDKPKQAPREKKPMPFAATRRHEYWTVDARYLDMHQLGWVHGMQRDPAELHRIFYTTRFGRKLDKLGYVRFRHWRIYAEYGLAGNQVAVWLYDETLLLEFSDEPLSQYSVAYEPARRSLRDVQPRQLFETQYRSPQIPQRELGDGEWVKVVRMPSCRPPRTRQSASKQLSLLV